MIEDKGRTAKPSAALLPPRSGSAQTLAGCAEHGGWLRHGVQAYPIERPGAVLKLTLDDGRGCVGRIATPRPDAAQQDVPRGIEPKPGECNGTSLGQCLGHGTAFLLVEDRIEHDRLPGTQGDLGGLQHLIIDFPADLRTIGGLRQGLILGDPEAGLPDLVAAQQNRARRGAEVRC